MSRVIKFRGLTIENVWVHGDLLNEFNDCPFKRIVNKKGGDKPVIINTIGQFIGLIDVNGKEVYEGDIVNFTRGVGNWQVPNAHSQLTSVCEVLYDSDTCRFAIKYNGNIQKIRIFSRYKFEVIGNIYETPELLQSS